MDFEPFSGEVCFPPSETRREVRVAIVADDIFEATLGEMFLLRLNDVPVDYLVQVSCNIARSVTTVTIVEDPSTCSLGHLWNFYEL